MMRCPKHFIHYFTITLRNPIEKKKVTLKTGWMSYSYKTIEIEVCIRCGKLKGTAS